MITSVNATVLSPYAAVCRLQSYLWNMATSQRIQRHGAAAVVAGDLVLPPAAAAGGPMPTLTAHS